MTVKTTLSRKAAWPGKPLEPRQMKPIDLNTLEICNDPLPEHRAKAALKYEALFSGLTPGQSIKCESADTGKLAHALNTYIKSKKIEGVKVISCKRYTDNKGRVWLIQK